MPMVDLPAEHDRDDEKLEETATCFRPLQLLERPTRDREPSLGWSWDADEGVGRGHARSCSFF